MQRQIIYLALFERVSGLLVELSHEISKRWVRTVFTDEIWHSYGVINDLFSLAVNLL